MVVLLSFGISKTVNLFWLVVCFFLPLAKRPRIHVFKIKFLLREETIKFLLECLEINHFLLVDTKTNIFTAFLTTKKAVYYSVRMFDRKHYYYFRNATPLNCCVK